MALESPEPQNIRTVCESYRLADRAAMTGIITRRGGVSSGSERELLRVTRTLDLIKFRRRIDRVNPFFIRL